MTLQTLKTPAGETLIVLSEADYEALIDAADSANHSATMAAISRGEIELLTQDEVLRALAAPTPLAFWREKRGMTQKALGAAAGVGQSYFASLESGARKGDPALFKRLATALKVRIEDLIAD